MSSISVKAAGTITSVRPVEVISPPMTAIAMGCAERVVAAEPDGHRQHAGDHGHGGHDDGARALVARLEDRGQPVLAGAHLLDGEVDEQNRVLGDDAHQHEEADHDPQRQRSAA